MRLAEIIAANIARARRAAGVTQAQLGAGAQLSAIHVAMIEAGTREPSLEAIGRLAEALGVEADQLATETAATRAFARERREVGLRAKQAMEGERDLGPGLGADVARNLRSHRRARGVTQSALSRSSGLSVAYIAKVERGVATPSMEALASLARALRVDPVALARRSSSRA